MLDLVVEDRAARFRGQGDRDRLADGRRLGLLLRVRRPIGVQPEGRQPEVVGRGEGERDGRDRGDVAPDAHRPQGRARLAVLQQPEGEERGLGEEAGLPGRQQDFQGRRLAEGPPDDERPAVDAHRPRRRAGMDGQPGVGDRLVADERQLDLGVGQEDQVLSRVVDVPEAGGVGPDLLDPELDLGQGGPVDALDPQRPEPVVAPDQVEGRRRGRRRELVPELRGARRDHDPDRGTPRRPPAPARPPTAA